GNARLVRNLLEAAISRQAQRITARDDAGRDVGAGEVVLLRPEDLPDAPPRDEDAGYGLYI
ncbi:MAG TPA: hypothetical protein VHA75_12820, partial [Rugosimonospora sp.]|nr:hypothetical protein [Rugosimonospora sp.]